VELGADINARDHVYERTPLFLASCEGRAQTVKALVAARADVLVELRGGCVASFWRAMWHRGNTTRIVWQSEGADWPFVATAE
jgi:hypothetical protein